MLWYAEDMDYKELTTAFWENVDQFRKKRGVTWTELSERTGHSAGSISTMKTMNKTPSVGFARSIAQALDVTIDELCSKGASQDKLQDKTILDVLIKICDGIGKNNIYLLSRMALMLKETNPHDVGIGIKMADEEGNVETIEEAIEKMKKQYL